MEGREEMNPLEALITLVFFAVCLAWCEWERENG
jgi:hypothetical protein